MDINVIAMQLFGACFSVDDNHILRRNVMISTFVDDDMFSNEFVVFFDLLKNFPRISPNEQFIEMFLRTNRGRYTSSKRIDFSNYRVGDNDAYVEFVQSVLTMFKEMLGMDVSDNDFEMAIEMYKMDYLTRHSVSILERSVTILSEGVQAGKAGIGGYDDMRKFMNKEFSRLDNIQAKKKRRGILTYTGDDGGDTSNIELKPVSTFGITALDKYIGSINQGDMVSVLAPAKGCKTRFCTMVLHNAIVTGVNVAMFPVENGAESFLALLRARHFEWYYNREVTEPSKLMFVDSDMIRNGKLTPKLKELEYASWTDLQTNKNYGTFVVIDEDFMLETFIGHFRQAVMVNNAQLICADYIQLIGSLNPSLTKVDRISRAYIEMLQFLKSEKIAGIFPAQLKQAIVGDLGRLDEDAMADLDLRDAAGESYEVIKTPDVNIALYGTPKMIKEGSMKLISIPSRNVAPFGVIDMNINAGTCTFESIELEDY